MTDSINSVLNQYQWLTLALKQASDSIMAIYAQDKAIWNLRIKHDQTPVTLADDACHQILHAAIEKHSKVPLLSEEGGEVSFNDRKGWSEYWLLDPLDGTKEFVERTDEFCICLALMQNNQPSLGFIYIPKTNELFIGNKDIGSARIMGESIEMLKPTKKRHTTWRIIGSRRSRWLGPWNDAIDEFNTYQCGSAIKFCRLAQGKADLYPRLGPTSELDTAAGQALLEGVVGKVVTLEGKPLQYNKANLLNPEFYAFAFSDSCKEIIIPKV